MATGLYKAVMPTLMKAKIKLASNISSTFSGNRIYSRLYDCLVMTFCTKSYVQNVQIAERPNCKDTSVLFPFVTQ